MIKQLSHHIVALLPIVALMLATLPVAAQSTPVYTPVYIPSQRAPIYIPQYRYNYTPTPSGPWLGHSLFSVHFGTGLFQSPSFESLTHSGYSPSLPFSISVRYAGEKYFANRFFWGWQSEGIFNHLGFDYTLDGDQHQHTLSNGTSSSGHFIHQSASFWAITLDERVSIGFDLSYYFSLNLSAGFYVQLLSGGSTDTWFTDKATGADTPVDHHSHGISFLSFNTGLSAQLELIYYITDNLFASCAAKAHFNTSNVIFSNASNLNQYSILIGIGYKSYSNRSHKDE